MSSNICYSGNYSFPPIGSCFHVPFISSITLLVWTVLMLSACPAKAMWLLDNFPEPCGKPFSYQPSSCMFTTYEIFCYPSTIYCRAISFFPISSYLFSFCKPSMYNRLQNYLSKSCCPQNHFSYGCQLQSFISCAYWALNFVSRTSHPLRHLSNGCQSLGDVAYSFSPQGYVSKSFQPICSLYSNFQPACSPFGTWQSPFIRSSCWIIILVSCQITLYRNVIFTLINCS